MASQRRSKQVIKEEIAGYLFVSPWFVGFILFIVGPMIASLFISMCEYRLPYAIKWVGLANYAKMLTGDPLFWKSLYNTVYYTAISVPLGIALSLAIAVLLNQEIKGLGILRTIYYLPSILSGVAVSLLWLLLLDPSFGMINALLEKIGIDGPLWLQDPAWSKPGIILMSLWQVGGNMIIYLAGLQGIPTQLYEAARIDGATSWRCFWSITLPMMTPTIFLSLVMGIIGSFQVFTQAYVMTDGGPLNSTLFYVLYLYRTGFMEFRMGYASALAWTLFMFILVLTVIIFRSSEKWVYYEAQLKG